MSYRDCGFLGLYFYIIYLLIVMTFLMMFFVRLTPTQKCDRASDVWVAWDCFWITIWIQTQIIWVIRQKDEPQNTGIKKTKIPRKTNISYPLKPTRTSQGVRNVCLFGMFGVLCFRIMSVLNFVFLPYYRRIIWVRNGLLSFILERLEFSHSIIQVTMVILVLK